MNSNRKRNLKKLARDIISATALVGSISAPGSQAIENQQSTTSTGSGTALTAAAMLAGCAGIAGTAYLGLKKNRETEAAFQEKSYQIALEKAKRNLELNENKALLERAGIDAQELSQFAIYCNEIKIENQSNKLITSDHVLNALRTGGDWSKDLLRRLVSLGSAAEIQETLVDHIAKSYTVDDKGLSRLGDAVSTITSRVTSSSMAMNSMACVSIGQGGHGDEANWNAPANDNIDRTLQIGVGNANEPLIMKGPACGFTLQNANFDAGAALLPDALKPIFGDILWCGIGFVEPNKDNENHAYFKNGASTVEKGMAYLDQDASKKTMSNGNVPLYLLISAKPEARSDQKVLDMQYFKGIPLFAELRNKRGKADSPDLKGTVGKWIVKNAATAPPTDRKIANNDYFN